MALAGLRLSNLDLRNQRITITHTAVEHHGVINYGRPKTAAAKRTISIGKEGNGKRIKAAKATGVPLIPWGDLRNHPNGIWITADGVAYLRGVDSLTPNTGGVDRTYSERPDAYGVDKDGVPLAALMKVKLEDVADWDEKAAKAETEKKSVRDRDAAVLAEYVGRKQRDHTVARLRARSAATV